MESPVGGGFSLRHFRVAADFKGAFNVEGHTPFDGSAKHVKPAVTVRAGSRRGDVRLRLWARRSVALGQGCRSVRCRRLLFLDLGSRFRGARRPGRAAEAKNRVLGSEIEVGLQAAVRQSSRNGAERRAQAGKRAFPRREPADPCQRSLGQHGLDRVENGEGDVVGQVEPGHFHQSRHQEDQKLNYNNREHNNVGGYLLN